MLNIIISLLTFVLILISLFMVLVILMQRANTNSGMGSAFGGGVTESAFGAETTNVLVRATKWSAAAFFVISLVLFLLHLSRSEQDINSTADDLPDIPVAQQTATDNPFADAGIDLQELPQQPSAAEESAADAQTAVDAFADQPVEESGESETPNP